MKVAVVSVFVMASLACVLAEPPVYLPPANNGYNQQQYPQQQYGPPSGPGGYQGGSSGGYPSGQSGGYPGGQSGGYPGGQSGGYPGGQSGGQSGPGGYDDGQYEPANYQFEYHVEDAPSGNNFGHEEQRQGDVATGRYFVLLPDGRTQIVEYVADQDGYRPKVRYEGVANNGGGAGGQGGYDYRGSSQGGAGGYNY